MTKTSDIKIVFNNPYTTEEFIKYLVKWTSRLNEQRFREALSSVESKESEDSAV